MKRKNKSLNKSKKLTVNKALMHDEPILEPELNFDIIEERLKRSFQAMKKDVQSIRDYIDMRQKSHSDQVKEAFGNVRKDFQERDNRLKTVESELHERVNNIDKQIEVIRRRLDHRDNLRDTVNRINELKAEISQIKTAFVQKAELGKDLDRVVRLIDGIDNAALKRTEFYKMHDKLSNDLDKVEQRKVERKEFEKMLRDQQRFNDRVESGKALPKDIRQGAVQRVVVTKLDKRAQKEAEKAAKQAEKERIKAERELMKMQRKQATAKVDKSAKQKMPAQKIKDDDGESLGWLNLITNIMLFLAFLALIGSIVTFFLEQVNVMDYFLIVGVGLLVVSVLLKIVYIMKNR